MSRANITTPLTNNGPTTIGVGLAIVLAAQLWPVIPIAAAIALIGFGATHALVEQRQHPLLLALNLAMYVMLALLAVGAQFDTRFNAMTMFDAVLAALITYKAATVGRAQC